MLTFPPNPTVGDAYAEGGGSWLWNAKSVWERGFTPVLLPTLITLDPNAATTGYTVEVSALGSEFMPASKVWFDGAEMATTFVSDSELTFTAPSSDTPKTVQVTVVTGAETSDPLSFEYTEAATSPPSLVSMSPTTPVGHVGPYTLVMDGFSFDGSAVTLFDGVEKGVTAYDGNYRIYCTINIGVDVVAGTTYQVSVRTGQGTSGSLPLEVQ